MRFLPRLLLPLAAIALLAAGCGQKGPLYLRDNPPAGVKPPKPAAPKPVPYPEQQTDTELTWDSPTATACLRRTGAARGHRAAFRHAMLRVFARRDRGRLRRVSQGARGPTTRSCATRSRPTPTSRCSRCSRASARASTSFPAASSPACSRPAATRARRVFSGVGKTRRRDPLRAASKASPASTSSRKPSSSAWTRSPASWAGARRSRSASTPTSTPRRTRTSPPDCARTSSAWRTPTPSASIARAAALPGIEVVGIGCHIGSQLTGSGALSSKPPRASPRSPIASSAPASALRAHRHRRRHRHPLSSDERREPIASFLDGALGVLGRAAGDADRRPGPLDRRQCRRAADAGRVREARRGAQLPGGRRGDERPAPPAALRRLARGAARAEAESSAATAVYDVVGPGVRERRFPRQGAPPRGAARATCWRSCRRARTAWR